MDGPRRWMVTAGAAAVLPLLGGCGQTADTPTVDGTPTGEIRVSAAASLTDAFDEMAAAFEQEHAGADVVLNLAGSATLSEQVLQGAPVDVFASADRETMEPVVAADLTLAPPRIFAHNRLRVAVPADNPGDVTGLGDFSDDGLLLGLCAPAVPCGRQAARALALAGVTPSVDTHEPDVRALLTKIEAGELDAGIVYATDVRAAGDAVRGIDLPADVAAEVDVGYPVAPLADAPNPAGAEAFVAFVLGEAGQRILTAHGFSSL